MQCTVEQVAIDLTLRIRVVLLQGQFTRFQRVFHIRPFSLLLRHQRAECISSLQASIHVILGRQHL